MFIKLLIYTWFSNLLTLAYLINVNPVTSRERKLDHNAVSKTPRHGWQLNS